MRVRAPVAASDAPNATPRSASRATRANCDWQVSARARTHARPARRMCEGEVCLGARARRAPDAGTHYAPPFGRISSSDTLRMMSSLVGMGTFSPSSKV